jgi:hypothetical protein
MNKNNHTVLQGNPNGKDDRSRCQFCGAVTWNRDYNGFMRDHDRPQGGRCLRATNVYCPKGEEI